MVLPNIKNILKGMGMKVMESIGAHTLKSKDGWTAG